MSTGMDAGLRVSDNAMLVECENGDYKLVIYDNKSEDNVIKDVYLLKNYKYNIHEKGTINSAKFIADFYTEVNDEEQAKTILDNISNLYRTIFKRYSVKSGRYVNLSRTSNSSGANPQDKSDRGRTSAKTRQYSDRSIAQSDRAYLSAVERGDIATVQRMVDEAANRANDDEFESRNFMLSQQKKTPLGTM